MKKKHTSLEQEEFLAIKKWFPEAELKQDYNREILDIGAKIHTDQGSWIILKGEQTNHCYELISPDFRWYEDLKKLEDVYHIIHSCRESS